MISHQEQPIRAHLLPEQATKLHHVIEVLANILVQQSFYHQHQHERTIGFARQTTIIGV
jgi:hypothetical protein